MPEALVPAFLKPHGSSTLVRIGRPNDGGYLVDQRDIAKADGLLGLGLNRDWSFEEQFLSLNDVPLLAIDGSVGTLEFKRDIVESLPRLDRPHLLMNRVKVLRDYRRFFTGRRKHVKLFVGVDYEPQYFIPLSKALAMARAEGMTQIYLKIDIEGSEYRILDDLIAHASTTPGLVIEFHDCDLHLDRIRDFVARYPLHLVHVHANNHAPVNPAKLPHVLELTFSSSEPDGAVVTLPHPHDQPNDPEKADIPIRFQ